MHEIRFALLRHGVTVWNAQKRIQGRTDISLPEETIASLQKFTVPPQWRQCPWFSSPLMRTRQTATALGLGDVIVAPEFIEMDWGDWEGQKLSDLRKELGAGMQRNEDRGWDFRPDGGESPRDVLARFETFLRAYDGTAFGAVTHKGVIRAIYAAARNWDMMGKSPDRLDWQALHVFGWSGRRGLRVIALNVPLIPRTGGPS